MKVKYGEIKTIIGFMMMVNKHYALSDEHFISAVVDVLQKCGLAAGVNEDILRLVVAAIHRKEKVYKKIELGCLVGNEGYRQGFQEIYR